MNISEVWLKTWVNPDISTDELAARLTMAGLEIEGTSPVAGDFSGVVVAEVVHTERHPDADKLTVCQVRTDESDALLTIVCGAKNVRAGLKVALATIGAKLPNGFDIKETKLRGILSQGMLCSSSELGMTEQSEGILELDPSALVGVDLRDYLFLNDMVLEVNITPNRADCFSVLGIAREVSALTGANLMPVPPYSVPSSFETDQVIHIESHADCPVFLGRLIRNIDSNVDTPWWMKEYLRRSGIRSIHPVVDVTNYVMLELGQPMHAFDASAFQAEVCVRLSREGDKIELLNGQEWHHKEPVLLVCDGDRPLSLAGVMGGVSSQVTPETTDIFLECAFFNPLTIAKTVRAHALTSDSSMRFERGVDPKLPMIAIERATQLLLQITKGTAGSVVSSISHNHLPPEKSISFSPSRVEKLTGVLLSTEEMKDYLQRLQMIVNIVSEDNWIVDVPSYRFDIHESVDLVEEIVRIYGYDKLPESTITTEMIAGKSDPLVSTEQKISDFFVARGFFETVHYSFVDPAIQKALFPDIDGRTLLNPISQDLSVMRVSLLPGLLASLIYNSNRQQSAIRLFEQGVIFTENGEQPRCAGLISGPISPFDWSEPVRDADFYDLKGVIEALFKSFHLPDIKFVKESVSDLWHPTQTAAIYSDTELVGYIGVLHPKWQANFDRASEVMMFELHASYFLKYQKPAYQAISKFPQVRRDLSFLVDNSVLFGDIETAVRGCVEGSQLKQCEIFDVFTGDTIPSGQKSLAIALIFQDNQKTLIDDEINQLIAAIIKRLEEMFSITLRD